MKQRLLKSMLLLCALVVGGVSSAWADVVTIWSENFDGLSGNATPTAPTNNAYAGVTYSCVNGAGSSPGNTKIMSENLAEGASAPELMVGKKGGGTGAAGGKFVAVIPLDNFEGTLTLTYYQNKQSLKVSSPTTGVSGGQTLKPSEVGQQTTTFTGITTNMTSITIEFEATTTSNVRLDDIVLTGTKATGVATPAFSPAAGAYTSAQNVTISCTDNEAVIYYTMGENPSDPTSSSTPYTGPIAVNTNTTIKAIAIKGNASSPVATAAYTIVSLEHAGTEQDPYTVADARNAIDANVGLTNVYVTGIVCTGGSNLSSGKMNYWISDDGTETNKLEAYKGKNLNNTNFTATTDVKVNDVVVIYGTLTKYGSTYELAEGNHLVSIDQSETPLINANNVSINYDATSGEITYTIDNPTSAQLIAAITTGNWISNVQVDAVNNKITFTAEANTGAQRTATITLSYTGAEDKVVTITQKKNGAADLPFTFDGGRSNIEATYGLIQNDLGSDYNSSPKLKFDGTGDYVILRINEVPGTLSFDIKGNGFSQGSTSTFKVQTSVDGENYSDLATYTELGNTKTVDIELATNVRFIKWVYTEKSAGNVALGNISLTKTPFVRVSSALYATYVPTRDVSFPATLTAYVPTSVGASSVHLEEIQDAPAGTPVIVKANAAGTYDLEFDYAGVSDEVIANNKLLASDGSVVGATGIYALGNKNSVVGFYKVKDGEIIPAGKCYLNTNASTKEFLGFSIDDDETAIESLTPALSKGEGAIYNLAGQRLNKLQKGINIVGGKKVMY
jgi:hypothetical protein